MIYTDINVYDAAMQRLDYIFHEFENVYVSFSGGKDSGLLLNLCLQWLDKNQPNRKLGVFHLDYEAQYTATTEYVDKVYRDFDSRISPYRCCVPFKVTTCTSMHQSFWRPWEIDSTDLWVRQLPENHLSATDFQFYTNDMWDYDFQIEFASWLHEKQKAKKTCCLVGIRAQESLNRWRAIAADKNINKYKNIPWTTKLAPNICNAYPIYDWKTEDIWTANARYGFEYNDLYNLFYLAGVPLNAMRVASPFISAGQDSLKLYRVIDPEVWGKLVSRVNGVNFTSIYGGTTAMGWKNITKPKHFTWREYMEFLLETLPIETASNYREKLATSIKFWRERGGVLSEKTMDDLRRSGIKFEVGLATNYKTSKLPVRMEYADDADSDEFSLIPTYKRMCICILKNDHLCKYMGFTLTKQETERRKAAIEKFSAL